MRLITVVCMLLLAGCSDDGLMLERAVADRDETIADLEARVTALRAQVDASEAVAGDLSDSQACVRRQDEVIVELRAQLADAVAEAKRATASLLAAQDQATQLWQQNQVAASKLVESNAAREKAEGALAASQADAKRARERIEQLERDCEALSLELGARPDPPAGAGPLSRMTPAQRDALATSIARETVQEVVGQFARAGREFTDAELVAMLEREKARVLREIEARMRVEQAGRR